MEFGFTSKNKQLSKSNLKKSIPSKSFQQPPSSDSDSDEIKRTNKDLIKSSLYNQTSNELVSALSEDPTLLSYDLYKTKAELAKKLEEPESKDSKYHENIKQHAELKKREKLILKEKQEARLREAEKEEFGETEEYFTHSYLEYMKKNQIFEEKLEEIDRNNQKTSISSKKPEYFLSKLICDPSEIPQKKSKTHEILEEEEKSGNCFEIDQVNDKRTQSQVQNARDRFLARKKQKEIK
jgi:hypothetical protein